MTCLGYLHLHSTYSYDGKVSLVELKQLLLAQGVQFACVTEHTDWLTEAKVRAFMEDCRRLSDESFLFIPGLEVSFPNAHIIVAGLKEVLDPQSSPLELVQRAQAKGAFVVFAHPHRSHFQAPEGVEPYLQAIEIWNGQYDGKRVPRPEAWSYRDKLAKKWEKNLFVTAGVDLHRSSHLPGPGLEIQVDTLDEKAVLQALHEGAYVIVGSGMRIEATAAWASVQNQAAIRRKSYWTIRLIYLARSINAGLARFHVRLPRGFREALRKRI